MTETSDQIAADAFKAAEVDVDGVKLKRRPLPELIEADRYLRDVAATATSNAQLGIRINQIVAPGGPE